MSNYSQKVYFSDIIALLRSMTIKSEYSANNINEYLEAIHGEGTVDKFNKHSWKYYLNLAGQLHPTDTAIYVNSLDTGERIEFTPSSFATHVATYRGFKPGTQKYKELIKLNPNKETQIKGVLFPVDIDYAVSAKNFTILSYDPSLIEPQEEGLIPFIQDWIYAHVDRYHVGAMQMSDELYDVVFISQMYALLVSVIIAYRQEKINTHEAHSFHVKNFLASHGGLDVFYDMMSERQRAYFYRNLRYLIRHKGKQGTFDTLHKEVLTMRGLPLTEYKLTRNHETIIDGVVTELPTSTPAVLFKSNNLANIPSNTQPTVTTKSMLDKTMSLAIGNKTFYKEEQSLIEGDVIYGGVSQMKTKVLESSAVQTSEGSSGSLQDTALSLWGYCAARNLFTTFVYFTDPSTGESIGLNAINAYHYFMYAYMQSTGVTLTRIPPVVAIDAPVWPKQSFEQVFSAADHTEITQAYARSMYNTVPGQTTFINNDTFHAFVESFNQKAIDLDRYVAYPTSIIGRASTGNMASALIATQHVQTTLEDTPYSDFLEQNALPAAGLTRDQWKNLQAEIFENATGQKLTQIESKSLIHEAMIKLMRQLSSYAVQFVADITMSSVVSLNWTAARIGQSREAAAQWFRVETIPLKITDMYTNAAMHEYINIPDFFKGYSIKGVHKSDEFLNMSFEGGLLVEQTGNDELLHFGLGPMHATINASKEYASLDDLEHVPPSLTVEELKLRTDNYYWLCAQYPTLPDKIDLSSFINTAYLPSFDVVQTKYHVLRGWYGFSIPSQIRYFGSDVVIFDLDAFEGMFGEETVDIFTPVLGNHLLDLFKFIPYMAPEISKFEYTFDYLKGFSFKQGGVGVDIGSFLVQNSHITVEDQVVVGSEHTLAFSFKPTIAPFEFGVKPALIELSFEYSGYQKVIDFNAGFFSDQFNMYFYGDPFVIVDTLEMTPVRVTPGVDFEVRDSNLTIPDMNFSQRGHQLDTSGGYYLEDINMDFKGYVTTSDAFDSVRPEFSDEEDPEYP